MMKIKSSLIITILFLTVGLIGIQSLKNYGVSIDEKFHRENGLSQYNYLKSFFDKNYDENFINKIQENIKEKNHFVRVPSIQPSFFDFTSEILIDLFKINSNQQIYKFKHLLNYLIFTLSLVFFYKFIEKRFKSKFLAIIGFMSLFLYPRIFANSFYNQKDIFFTSLIIIFIYLFYQFLRKNNDKYLIFLSITFAIMFTTRIFSIPIVLILFIFMFLFNENNHRKIIIDYLKFGSISALLIFLLWPYLWHAPVSNFIFGLKELLSYSPTYTILFDGNYISSNVAPIYYYLKWISITTPEVYVLLSVGGFILYSYELNKKNIIFIKSPNVTIDTFLFTIFIFIISLTLISKKGYNGWRHLYFLSPVIIYFYIFALNKIISFNKHKFNYAIIFLVVLNLLHLSNWTYKNQPHGNIYFNKFLDKQKRENYELDYWGLSNFNALQYLLKNEKSENIEVGTISFASIEIPMLILNEKDWKKIKPLPAAKKPKYLIDNKNKHFRFDTNILSDYKVYKEFIIDNLAINTIYIKK